MKEKTFLQEIMSPHEYQVQVALGSITKGFGVINSGTGFQVHFPNRYTVSVVFGPGTYSDHHNTSFSDLKKEPHESTSAEIAVFDSNGSFITARCFKEIFPDRGSDDVIGYVSPVEVVKIMVWAMAQ